MPRLPLGEPRAPRHTSSHLLHWLSQRSASGNSNACAVLLGRRSDLQYVALSCNNTNVIVPYIDLVNEVLEAAVAGTGGFHHRNRDSRSDGRPPCDSGVPQHGGYWTSSSSGREPDAHNVLRFLPFSPPFSFLFAQTTAHLSALGTSLSAVMNLFQGATGGPAAGAIAGATSA